MPLESEDLEHRISMAIQELLRLPRSEVQRALFCCGHRKSSKPLLIQSGQEDKPILMGDGKSNLIVVLVEAERGNSPSQAISF